MEYTKLVKFEKIISGINGKKIVIWGAAARGKELYRWLVFWKKHENVCAFIDNDKKKQSVGLYGKKVLSSSVIEEFDDEYVILIASGYHKEIEEIISRVNNKLERYNVCDYCLPSRAIETFQVYENRDIVLIDDKKTDFAIDMLKKINVKVSGIVSADSIGEYKESQEVYVIISENHIAIENRLIEKGYQYNRDYVVLTELFYEDYKYTKKECSIYVDHGTMKDKHMEEYFCPLPFTQLYYYEDHADICSPTWNNSVNVGNPRIYSIDEIWNSPMAKTIRASVLSGSYCFCNEEMCWRMLEGRLFKKSEITDEKWRDIIDNQKLEIEGGPEFLNIGYNPACNINCRMCRRDIVPKNTLDDATFLLQRLKDYEFKNLKRLIIPGNGELFLNDDYMDILIHIDEFRFPALEAIWIYSNGLLFTEENWKKIEHITEKYKVKVFISTDAVNPQTYQKIRRAKQNVLLKNFEFISDLRKSGKISALYLPFCCQKENFREMVSFVSFAKKIGADCVHFEKLFNSTVQNCIHREENVYYDDFVRLLKEAVLRGEEEGIEIDYKPFKKMLEI